MCISIVIRLPIVALKPQQLSFQKEFAIVGRNAGVEDQPSVLLKRAQHVGERGQEIFGVPDIVTFVS